MSIGFKVYGHYAVSHLASGSESKDDRFAQPHHVYAAPCLKGQNSASRWAAFRDVEDGVPLGLTVVSHLYAAPGCGAAGGLVWMQF